MSKTFPKELLTKNYSTLNTHSKVEDDEDWWWEMPFSEDLKNWAGSTEDEKIVGFIKSLLTKCRKDEVQEIRSTHTAKTKFRKLHPDPAVSGPRSVPAVEGWWSDYSSDNIMAVDCEMVAKIIGWKSNKVNGKPKPRCQQVAGKVVVVDYNGHLVYSQLVHHEPTDVYLTPIAREITGFTRNTFKNGRNLSMVQEDLKKLFKGKLLILIGGGSDFTALQMERGEFDVFDLHQFYVKESGPIGLRSLVDHYYNLDIQKGVHDPLVDAQYTMTIFREQYIPYKLQHPDEAGIRCGLRMFSEIKTKK